jgi:hypothetical protein
MTTPFVPLASPDYSKAALMRFVDTAGEQGLVSSSVASGWKYAVGRILEDHALSDDMRAIDAGTVVKRYHHKHPGVMKGTSLKEYQRRLARALADFKIFVEDPTKYVGRGRGPSDSTPSTAKAPKLNKALKSALRAEAESANAASAQIDQRLAELQKQLEEAAAAPPHAIVGLRLEFPMRPDFLATIMVPRDMKVYEARRFADFIMTLADDYQPKT